jgi:hypothetical protein
VTADHYPIPRYAGGRTEPGNIVAACAECNYARTAAETNRRRASESGIVAVAGDDVLRSPFEVLARADEVIE